MDEFKWTSRNNYILLYDTLDIWTPPKRGKVAKRERKE